MQNIKFTWQYLYVPLIVIALAMIPNMTKPNVYAADVKIFVQWAKANPQDWVLSDTGGWKHLQSKAEPVGDVSLEGIGVGDVLLNNAPGWVFAVNVQGVDFSGYDHYHVAQSGVDVIVTGWHDDPILYPDGYKDANVWTFHKPIFDPKIGQTNTSQEATVYAQPNSEWWSSPCAPQCGSITIKSWADFIAPTVDVLHGIYLSDAKWDEHVAARTEHGWREWVQ